MRPDPRTHVFTLAEATAAVMLLATVSAPRLAAQIVQQGRTATPLVVTTDGVRQSCKDIIGFVDSAPGDVRRAQTDLATAKNEVAKRIVKHDSVVAAFRVEHHRAPTTNDDTVQVFADALASAINDTVVDALALRQAIAGRAAADTLAKASAVAFCRAPAPATDSSAWTSLVIPRAGELAAADTIAHRYKHGSSARDELSAIPVQARQEQIAEAMTEASAAAAQAGASAPAYAAADWIVSRASKELNASIVANYAPALCTRTVSIPSTPIRGSTAFWPGDSFALQQFFGSTCTLLRGGDSEAQPSALALPAWSAVRVAFQRDVAALPDSIGARLRAYAFHAYQQSSAVPQVATLADRITVLDGMISFAATVQSTKDVFAGFAAASAQIGSDADSMATLLGGAGASVTQQAKAAPMSLTAGAYTVSYVAASVGGALLDAVKRADSEDARRANTDTAALYAIKAMAVNLLGDGSSCDAVVNAATSRSIVRLVQQRFPTRRCGSTRTAPFGAVAAWGTTDAVLWQAASVAAAADTAKTPAQRTSAYADAIVNALPVFAYAANPTTDSLEFRRLIRIGKQYGRLPSERLSQHYGDLVLDATLLAGAVGDAALQRQVLPPDVVRTIQFATDIAQAHDQADFAAAIERAAAPVDAYVRKRIREDGMSDRYATVNAYAGATGGFEYAHAAALPGQVGAKEAGLWIPVGVEVGWKESVPGSSWTSSSGRRASFGLLFQLIDLGQVATWRMQARDSLVKADPPSFQLQSLFSPGVFAVVHHQTFPISAGYGVSWAPRFREIATLGQPGPNASVPARADVWRSSVFVAVDVPVFP